jgi:hypothetical protein
MQITLAYAVERVCYYADLCALIVLPEQVQQQELALTLAPKLRFQVSNAEELLEYPAEEEEKRGLLVWGYRPLPPESEQEQWNQNRKIQATVRSYWQGNSRGVVVFTSQRPRPAIYTSAALPWYNGPFKEDFWEIELAGEQLSAVRYVVNVERLGERPSWKEKRRITFE